MKKIIATVLTTILALSVLTGCTQVAPNTVFSADDLPGKVIGVQLGTQETYMLPTMKRKVPLLRDTIKVPMPFRL